MQLTLKLLLRRSFGSLNAVFSLRRPSHLTASEFECTSNPSAVFKNSLESFCDTSFGLARWRDFSGFRLDFGARNADI